VVGHPEMRRAMLDTPIGGKDHIFGPIEWGDVARRPPDVTFEHRLRIHVGGHVVEAISMDGPAHTVGDVIVWVPHARAVFVGDLIFNGGTPFLVMGSVSGSHRAIEMIRGLEPEVIVPGHGPLCDYKVLDQTEDYLRFL